MPRIEYRRAHQRSVEDVRNRAAELISNLQSRMAAFDFDFEWRPDRSAIDFSGRGFKGRVELNATEVYFIIELSLALAPFRGMIESRIDEAVNRLFA